MASLAFWSLLLVTVCVAWGDDNACVDKGGKCQDKALFCSGYYQRNLCTGGANRRCCIDVVSDTGCTARNGICQEDEICCPGGYASGLCTGGVHRRCCLPEDHSDD